MHRAQSNEQRLGFLISGGSRAARIASSKTFFKPFCVRAEHSTYLTALSSLASFSPCSKVIAFCFVLASFSIVAASSLKSIWVPTRRKGVLGQWWVISGTHYKGRMQKFKSSGSVQASMHTHLPTSTPTQVEGA